MPSVSFENMDNSVNFQPLLTYYDRDILESRKFMCFGNRVHVKKASLWITSIQMIRLGICFVVSLFKVEPSVIGEMLLYSQSQNYGWVIVYKKICILWKCPEFTEILVSHLLSAFVMVVLLCGISWKNRCLFIPYLVLSILGETVVILETILWPLVFLFSDGVHFQVGLLGFLFGLCVLVAIETYFLSVIVRCWIFFEEMKLIEMAKKSSRSRSFPSYHHYSFESSFIAQ